MDTPTCCHNAMADEGGGGKYASIVTRDGDARFVQSMQTEGMRHRDRRSDEDYQGNGVRGKSYLTWTKTALNLR